MSSPFDRAEAMLSRAVDRTFASTVRIVPRSLPKNPNGRPIADPDRPPIEARGVISKVPMDMARVGKLTMSTRGAGERTELSIDLRELVGLDLRQGDRVESGLERYEVTETRTDGSRIVASLISSGRNFE